MINEILVSLITSVVTWTVLTFGKNVILPFYEKIVYKGVSISGNWILTTTLHENSENETVYTEKLFLKQNASNLVGNYTVVNFFKDKTQVVSTYDITGKIKDSYVVLNASIQDKDQIGCGSFVLKTIAGGFQLSGDVTLVNRLSDNIVTYSNCNYVKSV